MKKVNYLIIMLTLIVASCNTIENKTIIDTSFIDEQIEMELINITHEYAKNPYKYKKLYKYAIKINKDFDTLINKVERNTISFNEGIELIDNSYFLNSDKELFKKSCINKESFFYNLKVIKLNIITKELLDIKKNEFSFDSLEVCVNKQNKFMFNDNLYDTKFYTIAYSFCVNPLFIIDSIVSNNEIRIISDTITVYKGEGLYNSEKYYLKNSILYGHAIYINCDTRETQYVPFKYKQ